MTPIPARQRGSKQLWLDAAYDILISEGIDAVRVTHLAKRINQTRTGFYWFFQDLDELHAALMQRWENQNTGNLIIRSETEAANITEALFHLMDCWFDPALFDTPLDLAVRNWARIDQKVHTRLRQADAQRIEAVTLMFVRHGYAPAQAKTRGLTVLCTQIGYISMGVLEGVEERMARVAHYVEVFSGVRPSDTDVARFLERQDAGKCLPVSRNL